MENNTFSIRKESDACQKINLKGTIYTSCGKEAVIFDSSAFECYGIINFRNKSYYYVEIFKNSDSIPIAVVKPGDSYTLAANSFQQIEVKCKTHGNPSNCVFCRLCCDKGRLCYDGVIYVVFDCDSRCKLMCR